MRPALTSGGSGDDGRGAAAGFAGIKLPLVEAAIVASVFVIGLDSALGAVGPAGGVGHGGGRPVRALPRLCPCARISLDRGRHLHLGVPDGNGPLPQGVGVGLGWVVRRSVGDLGLRALGGMVVAGGALVLITN